MQHLLIQTFNESIWQRSLINIMSVGKSLTGDHHCSPNAYCILLLFIQVTPRVSPYLVLHLKQPSNTLISTPLQRNKQTKASADGITPLSFPPSLLTCPLNIMWVCICIVPSLHTCCKFMRKNTYIYMYNNKLFWPHSCSVRYRVHQGC